MTPEEIAEQVAPGFACASPSALSVSKTIICAIAARSKRGELSGVTHHFTFPQSALPIFDDPELAGRYTPVLWFIAVSYTHLDVYKRQVYYILNTYIFCATISLPLFGYFVNRFF